MAAVADGETGKPRVPCARALHGFQGQGDHELNFSAGVSILLLRRIDDNWLEGKLDGKIGIFPANHVKIEVGSPTVRHQSLLANSGRPYAIALHSFQGTQSGDLSFDKGELIELLGSVEDAAWIRGRLGATTGIFPKSFVEILRYPEESVAENFSPDSITRRVPKPRLSQTKPHPLSISEGTDGSTSPAAAQYSPQSARQTPVRSAPAPPSLRHTSRSTSDVRTVSSLPQPHPRRPRPRHTSADASSPSLTRSSSSSQLESELTIEKKLLESAEGLLAAGQQGDSRSRKIKLSINSHKDRIQVLAAQIEEVKDLEDNKVIATPTAPSTTSPPRAPPRPALPLSSKDKQRIKTIEELVATETDFCRQMDFCAHRVLPIIAKVDGVQVDCLFGNMAEVSALSTDFLAELEMCCGQDRKQARVGRVFISYAPRMKDVFGTYCRNHDTAFALYEKYQDTPTIANSMKERTDELRGEVQILNLQSLLIKPVQRVLKYPLLLQQLVKNTSDSHPDYADLHTANTAISKVAQDINEIKRRKDLVVKYTASKDERKGSMSFHSLQKKMRRFQQSLTQSAGLRPKTIDPKFDELEQKLLSLDLLIHGLVRNITAWQEELQNVLESYVTVAEAMKMLCSTSFLSNYLETLPKVREVFKRQAQFVKEQVTSPLEQLEAMFQNPFVLVQKRKDKLLDYDSLQYQLDHSEDSEKIAQLKDEVLLAKRNYEALNTQLLEELPRLLEAAASTVEHLLHVLLQAQHSFTSSAARTLQDLLTSSAELHPLASAPLSTSSDLQQAHAEQLTLLCKELTKLSLVPTSIAMTFSLRAGGGTRRLLEPNTEDASKTSSLEETSKNSSLEETSKNRSLEETSKNRSLTSLETRLEGTRQQEPISVTMDDREYATPIPINRRTKELVQTATGHELTKELVQTATNGSKLEDQEQEEEEEDESEEEEEEDEEEEEEEEKGSQFPAKGTLLHVLYDFEAEDPAELAVRAGQKVQLLCSHDKLGCTDWWLVEEVEGEGHGYVPATYVTFQPGTAVS